LPYRQPLASGDCVGASVAAAKSFFHRYGNMLTAHLRPAMDSAAASLIDELEVALAAGTNAQRINMLSRVTDLFIEGSSRYSDSQVNLFDEVIGKLTTVIEAKARAKLSHRLAPIRNAPPGVIRTLAFDDDIEVARPVLTMSERLDDADLVANASNKSQQHLAAIAERKYLTQAVAELLGTRRPPPGHSPAPQKNPRPVFAP